MTHTASMPTWFAVLRIAVFALLAFNTAWYFHAGSTSKGLDAAAWLLLLGLYSAETQLGDRVGRVAGALRALRLVAAGGVCAAGVAYLLERNALDAINTALWIGVVILLECEVRYPRTAARRRTAFLATAVMLYASLAALVAAWGWRGEWFDAYDALLWLVAFAALETDVLGVTGVKSAI